MCLEKRTCETWGVILLMINALYAGYGVTHHMQVSKLLFVLCVSSTHLALRDSCLLLGRLPATLAAR
jgi:hypothetical protein